MCLPCNKVYRGKSAGSSLRSHRYRVHVKRFRETTIIKASSWHTAGSFLRCSMMMQRIVSHEPTTTAMYENISEDEAESLPASQPDHAWWATKEIHEQNFTTEYSTTSEALPDFSQNSESAWEFDQWLDEVLARPVENEKRSGDLNKTVHRQNASSSQPMSDDVNLDRGSDSDTFRVDSYVLQELTRMAWSAISLEFLQERIRRWNGCPEWVGTSMCKGMHAAPEDEVIV